MGKQNTILPHLHWVLGFKKGKKKSFLLLSSLCYYPSIINLYIYIYILSLFEIYATLICLFLFLENARNTFFFLTKTFTNCWYSEWLLVNKKSDVIGGPRWELVKNWQK